MSAAIAAQAPFVRTVCAARLRGWPTSMLDPEDVAQDTLLSLLRADRRRPVQTTRAYLRGAIAHHTTSATRSTFRAWSGRTTEDLLTDLVDDGPGPEELAVRSALTRQVLAWLDELTELQRRIVVLRVAAGLSAEETAAAVGSTPGSVRVQQHVVMARLRELARGQR